MTISLVKFTSENNVDISIKNYNTHNIKLFGTVVYTICRFITKIHLGDAASYVKIHECCDVFNRYGVFVCDRLIRH